MQWRGNNQHQGHSNMNFGVDLKLEPVSPITQAQATRT